MARYTRAERELVLRAAAAELFAGPPIIAPQVCVASCALRHSMLERACRLCFMCVICHSASASP